MQTQHFKKLPNHIAIIPDGNRRWARKKGLLPHLGHYYGARQLEKILKKAYELKLKYFTFWIASFDNLTKRSKKEVNYLYKLFEDYFKKLKNQEILHKEKVRVRILGFWEELVPLNLKKLLKEIQEKTKDYNSYNLTFLLGYNGDKEMLNAITNIVIEKVEANPHLKEETLRKYLLTGELPDIDLLIRTGGEPHLSTGFMMWHTKYAQLYFTDVLWPDFSPKEFIKALKEYEKRERRFGK